MCVYVRTTIQVTYIVASIHDLDSNVLTVNRLHFRVSVFCKYVDRQLLHLTLSISQHFWRLLHINEPNPTSQINHITLCIITARPLCKRGLDGDNFDRMSVCLSYACFVTKTKKPVWQYSDTVWKINTLIFWVGVWRFMAPTRKRVN